MPRGKLWKDDLNQTMPIGDRMLLANLPETEPMMRAEKLMAEVVANVPVVEPLVSVPVAYEQAAGRIERKPHKVRPTSTAHRAIGQIERILSELDAPAQLAVGAYLLARLKAGPAS